MKIKLRYLITFFVIAIFATLKIKYLKILSIILFGWLINLFDPVLTNNAHRAVVSNSHNVLKDLTIIIPSCDKYFELWEPHFKMLFKNWPNLQDKYAFIPIYLISNFKKFEHPRITNIIAGEDKNWSDNLVKALDLVKTKYVLIVLEDYILDRPVDEERLVQIMHFMESTDAAYVQISYDPTPKLIEGAEDFGLPGMAFKGRFVESRVSLQTSLWNMSDLKSLVEPGESAWEFEILGSIRSRLLRSNFYLITKYPVFQYFNAVEKGKYRRSVIKYINNQNIHFVPISLPIDESR